ncbi:MAG TPA: RNA polymerase sigma factor [Solirubrobacteraceae bacterium]|jgi:RNA polymerase sigma factor (sigma-70 family)|nr:RNA polymerase sigma factor [Solirubrobacteraceae bacterium]
MEVSALHHAGVAGRHGRSPLFRLQTDERLIALTRRGNHHAFEALVSRYQPRLLSFCRHMLGSKEDAEDVLQEVFAAAFNAILADDREINVRPWLYRIARNRSLNHLRRVQPIGVDSMDIHYSEQGTTTADKVHRREDFRMLIEDVQGLPETQRTALLLREIDALSYEQISEAMETTVPSVKSLLVRARVSLAEAAEARQISCDAVRLELGEVAEGLQRMSPPVRRHVKLCERCDTFRKQLRETNKALAAVFPIGPLVLFKKFALIHLGIGGAGGSGAAAGGAAGGAAAGSAVGAGAAGGGLLAGGAATLATKTAAGLAAAALVTAGAVEVRNAGDDHTRPARDIAASAPAAAPANAPTITRALAGRRVAPHTRTHVLSRPVRETKRTTAHEKAAAKNAASSRQPNQPNTTATTTTTTAPTATTPTQTTASAAPPADPPKLQTSGDTTTLPPTGTTTTTTAPPPTMSPPPPPPPPTTAPVDAPPPTSPPAEQAPATTPPDDGSDAPPADAPSDGS